MTDPGPWDLFLSHRSTEKAALEPLREALQARGLRVWVDDRQVPQLAAAIGPAIGQGLARSRALLAWATPAWWDSRPCQWELAAAVTAALREGRPPLARALLVVPPGVERDHLPDALRTARIEAADAVEDLADAIASRVSEVGPAVIGQVTGGAPPPWLGKQVVPAPRFEGRLHALWAVHGALQGRENAVITGTGGGDAAAVHGLGGNGKTLLAEEYALRFRRTWPGGIVWIDAAGSTPAQAWEGVLRERGVEVPRPVSGEPEQAHHQRLRGLLRATLGEDLMLWVVDDPPAGPCDDLDAWLCPARNGRTLLTTRVGPRGRFRAVPLSTLSADSALRLVLRDREVPPVEGEAARRLVAALGHHALAVDVAGALATHSPFAALLEEITSRGSSAALDGLLGDGAAAERLRRQLPTGHEPRVLATLALSFDRLEAEARDALRACSWLGEAPIPVWLVDAAVAGAGVPAGAALRGRLALVDEGLAVAVEAHGSPALEVHGLVREAARLLEDRPARLEATGAAAEAALEAWLASRVKDARRLGEAAPLVGHAEAVGARRGGTGRLLDWVGWFHREGGRYVEAREVNTALWRARAAAWGESDARTMAARNNLATALRAMGELEGARAHQDTILQVTARILGPEHRNTLTSRNNLAVTLHSLGDLDGARTHKEATLEAHARTLGPEHPSTLATRNSLSITLRAQGDLSAARAHQEAVLTARERTLGPGHPATLASRNDLGETLRLLGDPAGARHHLEAVHAARMRTLGREHPDTLSTRNSLANTLLAMGDLAGARAHGEAVVEALARSLGPEHPKTLASRNDLAIVLGALGDLDGARIHQEAVIAIQARALGADHPATLVSRSNLATTLRSLGDLAGARDQMEAVGEALERTLGPEHPHTLSNRGNLAQTLRAQGDLDGARTHQEEVLAARERTLGPDHPATLNSRNNLAHILHSQGDQASARAHQEAALEALQRTLGPDHPDTLTCRNNLAATLRSMGDLASARAHHEAALAGRERTLGPDHPDTLTSTWNLLCTLSDLGAPAPAALTRRLDALAAADPAALSSAALRALRDTYRGWRARR